MTEALSYIDLQERITDWAKCRQDIQAVFVIGSRGRNEKDAARRGSDLDVLIVSSHPKLYQKGFKEWCCRISPLAVSQHQEDHHMVFVFSDDYYAIFKPDLDVDFSIVSLRRIRQEIQQAKWFIRFPRLFPKPLEKAIRAEASAFRGGFRVLLDRELLAQEIQDSWGQIPWSIKFPTETEFLSVVDEFLIYTFKAFKKSRSGKLFHAKWICDATLKMQLIRMAEWHVHSQNRQDEPVRYRDLAVDEWSDLRVRDEIQKTFAIFDLASICQALYASLNLFYWITAETAKNLGYQETFSTAVDHIEWLRAQLESSLQETI